MRRRVEGGQGEDTFVKRHVGKDRERQRETEDPEEHGGAGLGGGVLLSTEDEVHKEDEEEEEGERVVAFRSADVDQVVPPPTGGGGCHGDEGDTSAETEANTNRQADECKLMDGVTLNHGEQTEQSFMARSCESRTDSNAASVSC